MALGHRDEMLFPVMLDILSMSGGAAACCQNVTDSERTAGATVITLLSLTGGLSANLMSGGAVTYFITDHGVSPSHFSVEKATTVAGSL